ETGGRIFRRVGAGHPLQAVVRGEGSARQSGRDEPIDGIAGGNAGKKKHALWGPKRPPQRVGLPGGGTSSVLTPANAPQTDYGEKFSVPAPDRAPPHPAAPGGGP